MQKHRAMAMAAMTAFMMSSMAAAKDLSLDDIVKNQKLSASNCAKEEQVKISRVEVLSDKQVLKMTKGQASFAQKGKKYLAIYGDPKKKWQLNIPSGPVQDDLTSEVVTERLKGMSECFVDPDTL